MQEKIRSFFSAPIYADDPEKNQDAMTTHRVGVVLLVLAAFSIPFILLLQRPVREYALGATILGMFIWTFTIHLVKQEKIAAAKMIVLGVNTVNLFGVIYALGGLEVSTVFTTMFLLALANLLFPNRGAIVYGIVLFTLTTTTYFLGTQNLLPEVTTPDTARSIFFIYTFTIVSVSGILAIASANSRRNLEMVRKNESELRERNLELDQLRKSLERRVMERTTQLEKRANQLEAISSVARSTTSLQNLEELLPAITKLVSSRFGYYHSGIFLLDENQEYAILRATNSEGGQRMLSRQHKLKLDAKSIVGYVTSRGEPRVALDVGTDAVYFDNPDLPETRSEMALPLRVGGRVIGALDVQSTEPNAFSTEDITTLVTLADQVAIAIENARLFSEAQEALKEAEEAFGRYVQQEWSSYAKQTKNTGYLFDGKRTTPSHEHGGNKKSTPLPQTGSLILQKEKKELIVPIRLRGQIIGYLNVKSKNEDRKWTQDDLTLLESAVERTALALENARLVDSAQRRASRERTIGEISTKIGAVGEMEAIMQAAVEELGRRIGGATEVILELAKEKDDSAMRAESPE